MCTTQPETRTSKRENRTRFTGSTKQDRHRPDVPREGRADAIWLIYIRSAFKTEFDDQFQISTPHIYQLDPKIRCSPGDCRLGDHLGNQNVYWSFSSMIYGARVV
jgi:hypothetical protein